MPRNTSAKRTRRNSLEIAYAFGDFVRSDLSSALLAHNRDATTMLRDLRRAKLFPYFGIKVGAFTAQHRKDRKRLHAFITRAYRGQSHGIQHWRRVGSLLWRAHDSMLRLHKWAASAERIKHERAARAHVRRAKERRRLRAYRANNKRGGSHGA